MKAKHYCKLCGHEILNRHLNSKYCRECADNMVGMSEQARSEYKEYIRKMATQRKPKRSDGYTIEQIVALAAEANMTYGEYVLKMEEGLV